VISALLLGALLSGQEPPAPQAPPPPVFATGVEAVYLDVFVTRSGKPVTGLRARDFEVRDNGVVQDASLVQLDRVDLSAVLAFDVSYSVQGEKLSQLKAAARAFVRGLGRGDEAALLSFSQEIVVRVPPTLDRTAVFDGIDGLEAGGATAIFDTLYLALRLPWGRGRPVFVLFTDGQDTASWLGREAAARAVLHSPAVIQVIATIDPGGRTPDAAHMRGLRELAESTGGQYWRTDSPQRLADTFLGVLEALKARYLLSYRPEGVDQAGTHRLAVTVRGRGLEVRARSEYWAGP
jgi:Ca-activated chloride channel family protein